MKLLDQVEVSETKLVTVDSVERAPDSLSVRVEVIDGDPDRGGTVDGWRRDFDQRTGRVNPFTDPNLKTRVDVPLSPFENSNFFGSVWILFPNDRFVTSSLEFESLPLGDSHPGGRCG